MFPVVFFDLETTGLPSNDGRPIPDILHLGAIDSFGNNEWSSYLRPTMPIEKGATRVNGFTCSNDLERLYLYDEEVQTDEPDTELVNFMNWLREYREPVLLIAHNCFKFDAKILLLNLEKYGIRYEGVIWGFSDSLKACQQYHPAPRNLEHMLSVYGCNKDQSHDALEDAMDVRVLVRRMAATLGFDFQSFVQDERWCMTLYEQQCMYGIQTCCCDEEDMDYDEYDEGCCCEYQDQDDYYDDSDWD